jgi:hypothetical protein
MHVSKEVLKQANASVSYFQQDIDQMVEYFEYELDRVYAVPVPLAKALAASMAQMSSTCGTKYCSDCVTRWKLMDIARMRMTSHIKEWSNTLLIQEASFATRNNVTITHGANFAYKHKPAVVQDFVLGAMKYLAESAPAVLNAIMEDAKLVRQSRG